MFAVVLRERGFPSVFQSVSLLSVCLTVHSDKRSPWRWCFAYHLSWAAIWMQGNKTTTYFPQHFPPSSADRVTCRRPSTSQPSSSILVLTRSCQRLHFINPFHSSGTLYHLLLRMLPVSHMTSLRTVYDILDFAIAYRTTWGHQGTCRFGQCVFPVYTRTARQLTSFGTYCLNSDLSCIL